MQPVVSLRRLVPSFEDALGIFDHLQARLSGKGNYGLRYVICHSDGLVDYDMELELGYFVDAKPSAPQPVYRDQPLQYYELPAVDTMATFVVEGALENIHLGYWEIGTWAEQNGYRLSVKAREVKLQNPQIPDGSDLITEIQFPVDSVDTIDLLF